MQLYKPRPQNNCNNHCNCQQKINNPKGGKILALKAMIIKRIPSMPATGMTSEIVRRNLILYLPDSSGFSYFSNHHVDLFNFLYIPIKKGREIINETPQMTVFSMRMFFIHPFMVMV